MRGKIQDVISLYKEKEAVYRAQMQNQKENLKKIEESVRQQLDEHCERALEPDRAELDDEDRRGHRDRDSDDQRQGREVYQF